MKCYHLLALVFLVMRTEAFVVSRGSHRSSALSYTEESEWYSPPVKVEPKALQMPGVVPAETTVESSEDFLNFLYDQDDGRLTVVKYTAVW